MIQVKIDTTVCEFLLGIPSNGPMIKILNFVILNTKVYINNKKSNEEPLNWYEFKNELKANWKHMKQFQNIKTVKKNLEWLIVSSYIRCSIPEMTIVFCHLGIFCIGIGLCVNVWVNVTITSPLLYPHSRSFLQARNGKWSS